MSTPVYEQEYVVYALQEQESTRVNEQKAKCLLLSMNKKCLRSLLNKKYKHSSLKFIHPPSLWIMACAMLMLILCYWCLSCIDAHRLLMLVGHQITKKGFLKIVWKKLKSVFVVLHWCYKNILNFFLGNLMASMDLTNGHYV